jgi:hypothetical protein
MKPGTIKTVRILPVVAVLWSMVAHPMPGHGYEAGVRVVNGTEMGRAPNGITVKLNLLKRDGKREKTVRSLEGRTDAEGRAMFSFEDIGEADRIGAETEYRGIRYGHPSISLSPDQESYEISLKIYEIADEEELVKIKDRQVYVRNIKNGVIDFIEVVTLSNEGDRTYVGAFNDESQLTETARIGLPGGYESPGLQGQIDLSQTRPMSNSVVLLEPIHPGEKIFYLSYKLRSEIGKFDLAYPVWIPTLRFRMFIPQNLGWKVKVKKLRPAKNVKFEGAVSRQWEGRGLGMVKGTDRALSPDVISDIGYALGPKIVLRDPAVTGWFGVNEFAILAAFFVSAFLGVSYMNYVKTKASPPPEAEVTRARPKGASRTRDDERERLRSLIERLGRETGGNPEAVSFYEPYRKVLADRVAELGGMPRGKSAKSRLKK